MRSSSTSALLWGAGLVLVSGCVWAARIWDEHPQATGPDLRSLQQLAARVDQAPEAAPALDLPTSHGPALLPPPPPRPVPTARPATTPRPVPARIEPRPEGRRPTPPTLRPEAPAPPAPALNDDAVKNLALLGVTFADGKDAAWLMDVSSRTREMAAVGESVLGFTVKEIEPDRVLLTRDGRDYSLRLGEKPNLVASASPVTLVSASDTGEDDSPFGFGPGGPGGRRGQGEPGGFGPGGFGNRQGGFGPGGFGQFGGAGAFGGGRFGGGSFGGGNFGGGGSNSSGGGSTSSGTGNSGGGGVAAPGGGFGGGNTGGFAGGGFGGGFGQTGTSSTSRTSSAASGTTSNPQTARRQGSRLTGDADPVEQPATIVNPQTQRRTGSSNQPAFGNADTTVRGQTGSGRTGTGSTGSR